AAAELHDIESTDVAENLQLRLGTLEDAPRDLFLGPRSLRRGVGVLLVRARPVRDVLLNVVRALRRAHRPRTTVRSRARRNPGSRNRARGCRASRARDRPGSNR